MASRRASGAVAPRVGALAGLRVVDFGWAVAGPSTTKQLAHFGAEVLKIESVHRPDSTRGIWPWAGGEAGPNRSGYFSTHNASKLSVTINLSVPEGRELIRRLVAQADIVNENFSPGTLQKMGLDFAELARINPAIILLSSSGMGQSGPYARHPGLGYLIQAAAGLNHLAGWPDREPLGPNGPYPDLVAPWVALPAILSALDRRDRSGRGQWIDLSQLEATIHFIASAVLEYTVNDRVQTRDGNRHPYAAPHGAYPVAGDDRWVAIACYDDAQWRALAQVVGGDALAADGRFATLLRRKRNEAALDALLGAWTAGRAAGVVIDALHAVAVPVSIVARAEDLYADPQLAARGHFVELDHAEMGPHPNDAPSFQLSRTPAELHPAPLLGEDTAYALRDLLGLSEREIAALTEAHALE